MIKQNNALGEDTFNCKVKCLECKEVVMEASNIPDSETSIALLALTNSKEVRVHTSKCTLSEIDYEWTKSE